MSDAYVIHMEAGDGRRLLTRIPEADLTGKTPADRLARIGVAAKALALQMELAGGHVVDGTWKDVDGELVEVTATQR